MAKKQKKKEAQKGSSLLKPVADLFAPCIAAAGRVWNVPEVRTGTYVVLFLLWVLAVRTLGTPMICITIIFGIFWNLGEGGEGRGGISAYSVFNRGVRSILGDLRAEQIEGELRHGERGAQGAGGGDLIDLPQERLDPIPMTSRTANVPCPCGSGRKLKKCCGTNDPRRAVGGRAGALDDFD
uniref:SAYSvFN domain-containing protein n=1 Tax=Chromera velia CCMP2878 TaxID=1169474 RepID=A0A0G4HTK5_9ALVE|eukprot:Cvel_31375.t1-p1 / transcript=Cvel_31375.t1 / gene=Cvel_31375 / organism=Chromera_velia_CCMP2878 / gene_product=hypothetical protein / transcript_product=hypothetical protein / location=Cvel_scaffold4664:664-3017(+) / protein_length=181 / sequence_SO=supercontig / SO=protein_coding / is_pseudo=false